MAVQAVSDDEGLPPLEPENEQSVEVDDGDAVITNSSQHCLFHLSMEITDVVTHANTPVQRPGRSSSPCGPRRGECSLHDMGPWTSSHGPHQHMYRTPSFDFDAEQSAKYCTKRTWFLCAKKVYVGLVLGTIVRQCAAMDCIAAFVTCAIGQRRVGLRGETTQGRNHWRVHTSASCE